MDIEKKIEMDNYPDELIKLLKLKDIEKNLLTYKKNYRIKKR